MPEIIDVILMKSQFSDTDHAYLVLDKMPEFRFERVGPFLIAEDDGFFACYGYERPSAGFVAFGGRKFDIPLVDGTVVKADGQWWWESPNERSGVPTMPCAISTAEELNRCYVFSGGHVSVDKFNAWLAKNAPSRDYNKYRKPVAVT